MAPTYQPVLMFLPPPTICFHGLPHRYLQNRYFILYPIMIILILGVCFFVCFFSGVGRDYNLSHCCKTCLAAHPRGKKTIWTYSIHGFSLISWFYIQKQCSYFALKGKIVHQQQNQIHRRIRSMKGQPWITHLCWPWNCLVHRRHSFNEQVCLCSATNIILWPTCCLSSATLSFLFIKKNLHLFHRKIYFYRQNSKSKLFTEWLRGACGVTMCL